MEAPRSRGLRVEVEVDIPAGAPNISHANLDEAIGRAVSSMADVLRDEANVTGHYAWRRELYYRARDHGAGGGTFTVEG